jgi:hypothetical protein
MRKDWIKGKLREGTPDQAFRMRDQNILGNASIEY